MSAPIKKAGKKPFKGKPMSLAMPSATPESSQVVSVGVSGVEEDIKKLDESLLKYANRELTIGLFQFINAQGQMATKKMAVLGKGTYGDVYRMRLKSDRTPLAVKTLNKDKFYMTEETRKSCKTQEEVEEARKRIAKARSRLLIEIAILQELTIETQGKHDHLLAYHATFFDSDNIYIVMELFTGVELFQYLAHKWTESKGRLPLMPLRDMLIISSMLLEALQFIHRQGIIHRDVKLENVMVKPDRSERRFQLKLIDFGQAKYTRSKAKPRVLDGSVSPGPGTTTPTGNGGLSPLSSPAISVTPSCGSMIYLPIEALSKIVDKEEWLCTPRFASKLDIYACGMMILILLRGPPRNIQDLAQPVSNESADEEKERHKKLLKEVQSSYLFDELDKVEEQYVPLASLARQMLCVNPMERPTTEQCISRLCELAPDLLVDKRCGAEPLACVTLAASVLCSVVYGAVAEPVKEITPPTNLTLPAGFGMGPPQPAGPLLGTSPPGMNMNMNMVQNAPEARPGAGVPMQGSVPMQMPMGQAGPGGISLVGMPPGMVQQHQRGVPQQQVPYNNGQVMSQPGVPVMMQGGGGVGGGGGGGGGYQANVGVAHGGYSHGGNVVQPGGAQVNRISAHQGAGQFVPQQAHQQQQQQQQQPRQWNPYETQGYPQQNQQQMQQGGYQFAQPMGGAVPQQGQQGFQTAAWMSCMRAHDDENMRRSEGV